MPVDVIAMTLSCDESDVDVSNMEVHKLHARERFNQLYEIELEVACLGSAPDLDTIEGARLTVQLTRNSTPVRSFTGIVVEARDHYGHANPNPWYRLKLAPQFFVSTLVEKFDVRLNEGMKEMLDAMLLELGMTKNEDYQLGGALEAVPAVYDAREMMVQFRETDFAFISRWCEHYGIYYFFTKGAHGDELQVFGDDTASYLPIDAVDDHVPFIGGGEHTGVYSLYATRRLVPVTYVCRDYNEDLPSLDMHADLSYTDGFGGGIFDYGGHTKAIDECAKLVAVRSGEQVVQRTVYSGQSDDPRFAPGHTFDLTGHPAHSGERVLVEVEHWASQDVAGWGNADETPYRNRFVAIDASVTYRPPRETPKPRVHGLISAIVHSGQGAVADTAQIDSEGRYIVNFLFDSAVTARSCPVRMIQPSAGPNYGIHFPLKPGIEVAIAFRDGNPDRPLIVGAVPNTITRTPVTSLDGSKNRIKSRSGILIEMEDAARST